MRTDIESSNAGLLDSVAVEELVEEVQPRNPPPRKFLMSRSNTLASQEESIYVGRSSTPLATSSSGHPSATAVTSRRAASISLALFLFLGGMVGLV